MSAIYADIAKYVRRALLGRANGEVVLFNRRVTIVGGDREPDAYGGP